MSCQCGARRESIVKAIKGEQSALTTLDFVVKTSVEDVSSIASNAASKAAAALRRRGIWPR